jgi:hypothetical protein
MSITGVIDIFAQEQVVRVDTRRIVTMMTNNKSLWYLTIHKCPGYSVG